MAFSITSHATARSPEDEHCVLAHVEELLPAPQHPLQAGVGYNTQACAPTDVLLIPEAGSIVHTNNTLRAVDFFAPLARCQLPRAGHQGTSPAVHFQRLWSSKLKSQTSLQFHSHYVMRQSGGREKSNHKSQMDLTVSDRIKSKFKSLWHSVKPDVASERGPNLMCKILYYFYLHDWKCILNTWR